MSVPTLQRDTAFQVRSLVCSSEIPMLRHKIWDEKIILIINLSIFYSFVPFSVSPRSSPTITSANMPAGGRRMPSASIKMRRKIEGYKNWFKRDCRTYAWWRLVGRYNSVLAIVWGCERFKASLTHPTTWLIRQRDVSMSLTVTTAANDYQPILSARQVGGGGPEDGKLFQTRYLSPRILILHEGKANRTGRWYCSPEGYWVSYLCADPEIVAFYGLLILPQLGLRD